MKPMLSRIILTIIWFFYAKPAHSEWKSKSLQEKKQEAIQILKARKQGFDTYQKMKADWEKQRQAVAFKQKIIRKNYLEKKEKARKNFVRTTSEFPKEEYKKFIEEREKKRESFEKSRKEYSKVQEELKKILDNKEYKINEKKEYQL